MDGLEGLDNVQDISPALEATEDFLHCLDGIYEQRPLQKPTVDLQHFRQAKRLQDASGGESEKRSSSDVWGWLAGEQSEFGRWSFAWADHQPPSAFGLRPGKKSRAQSTNDLASQSKEWSNVSNAAFRKGHNRSRSDVNSRPSGGPDSGPTAPDPRSREATKDGSRAVVVKQAELEAWDGPGWTRCRLQLTPCELRLYNLDKRGSQQLLTAYSLSHCQSVSSPAPVARPRPADEHTIHALFFNSTHLRLRTKTKQEAVEWKTLIWEGVLASRPTKHKHQLKSNRPTVLPLLPQLSPDVLKVGLLQLLVEQNHWRTLTFVLTQTLLQGFLTEGRGPISEPFLRYHLTSCLTVEHICKSGSGNIFTAVFPSEVLWLQAESTTEALSWVEMLCKRVEVQTSSRRHKEIQEHSSTLPGVEEPRRRAAQQEDQRPATSSFLSLLSCLAVEKGLTAQSFKCAGCQCDVGLSGARAKVCSYSGWYYCSSCHQDHTFLIPARLLHNWDTGKHKVSKQAKEFLEFVYEEPLLDVQLLNPFLYQHCEPLSAVLHLRQRLRSLRAYLFSCRTAVAEDLRRRIFPREYLLQHIHLYSLADLQQVIDGKLAPFLSKVIKFASSHVFGCSLCQQKGFVCELCRTGTVIFPFQETERCQHCDAVFHAACHQKARPCPRCVRRERLQRPSACGSEEDLQDCYQDP